MVETKSETHPRRGLRQRLFARFYAGETPANYEAAVEPYKRDLIGSLSGTVLEIGVGTGDNFPFYAQGIEWIGIEPNVYMHPALLDAAKQHGISGSLHAAVAEKLPVEDASVDAVVSTLVLCSVSDQAAVLREILRVLRPGGRYVFIEHVAAPERTRLLLMQKLSKPFWRMAADGCEPDRHTAEAIREAGFSRVEIQAFDAPLWLANPHIAGVAVK